MNKPLYISLIFLIACFVFVPGTGLIVEAQEECPSESICIDNPIEAETFEELVENIINYVFNIAIIVAPIMFIVAGLSFITAGGDPTKIKRASNIILWTAVGLVLAILAYGLVRVIKDIFLVAE